MSIPNYYRIVAEIRRVCVKLSLQLPTHSTAIASQVRNIHRVCSKLELIKQKVHLLSYRAWSSAQREQYRILDELLDKLLTEATNMALLAEEFSYDPEGSLSCLREVSRRKTELIEQLGTMAQSIERQSYVVSPSSTSFEKQGYVVSSSTPLTKSITKPLQFPAR
ncbi:MAG: hypothetical protein F6K16_35400 [Symploca sp. SIO2B6]|nr:hypothetical protein [Symploca sp. SIO2B6]